MFYRRFGLFLVAFWPSVLIVAPAVFGVTFAFFFALDSRVRRCGTSRYLAVWPGFQCSALRPGFLCRRFCRERADGSAARRVGCPFGRARRHERARLFLAVVLPRRIGFFGKMESIFPKGRVHPRLAAGRVVRPAAALVAPVVAQVASHALYDRLQAFPGPAALVAPGGPPAQLPDASVAVARVVEVVVQRLDVRGLVDDGDRVDGAVLGAGGLPRLRVVVSASIAGCSAVRASAPRSRRLVSLRRLIWGVLRYRTIVR